MQRHPPTDDNEQDNYYDANVEVRSYNPATSSSPSSSSSSAAAESAPAVTVGPTIATSASTTRHYKQQTTISRAFEEKVSWSPPIIDGMSSLPNRTQAGAVLGGGRSPVEGKISIASATTFEYKEEVLRKPPPNDKCKESAKSLSFPWKLYYLLEGPSPLSSPPTFSSPAQIISWMPNGKAFCIHNKVAFCSEIMPRYFRQSKFESFTRQLYIYGFSKVESSASLIFAHPSFVRGKKDDVVHIGRNRSGVDRRKRRGGKNKANRRSSDTTSDDSFGEAIDSNDDDRRSSSSSLSSSKRPRQQHERQQGLEQQQQHISSDLSVGQEQPNLAFLQHQPGLGQIWGSGVGFVACPSIVMDVCKMASSDDWRATMVGGGGNDHLQQWSMQQQRLHQQELQHQTYNASIALGSNIPPNANPRGFQVAQSLPLMAGMYQPQGVSTTIRTGVDVTHDDVSQRYHGGDRQDVLIYHDWDLEPRPIEDMIAASRKWDEDKNSNMNK